MKSITVDSSFLINLYLLGQIDLLCKTYIEVLISPTVRRECLKIKSVLDTLPCIKYVELTSDEKKKVETLHKELEEKFAGQHRGETEALVLAASRGVPLMISDNFAPWYLKSKHEEIAKVKLVRGSHIFIQAIENKILVLKNKEDLKNLLRKLEGIYPKKTLDFIWRKFEGRFK